MNPLDTSIGRYAPGIIHVIVEIAKGSKKKYRYHRKKRAFVLDYRLMIPAPAEYGWIPETLSKEGKRLDALVLVRKPTWAGNLCQARPIGTLRRRDGDHKILCVLLGEPRFENIHDITDLDDATLRRIAHFFEPFFHVNGWMGRDETIALLVEAHRNYKERGHLHELPDTADDEDEDFPEDFDSDFEDDEPVHVKPAFEQSRAHSPNGQAEAVTVQDSR